MILVCQEESLWQGAVSAVYLSRLDIDALNEAIGSKLTRLLFGTLVIGGCFWVTEYLGLEQVVIGIGGFVEESGALCMEFERRLEAL